MPVEIECVNCGARRDEPQGDVDIALNPAISAPTCQSCGNVVWNVPRDTPR